MRRPPLTTIRVFNDFPHAPASDRGRDGARRPHAPGDDWRTLAAGFHLARAHRHLELLAAGDVSEPHLLHTTCRLLMELERNASSHFAARSDE